MANKETMRKELKDYDRSMSSIDQVMTLKAALEAAIADEDAPYDIGMKLVTGPKGNKTTTSMVISSSNLFEASIMATTSADLIKYLNSRLVALKAEATQSIDALKAEISTL